MKLVTFRTADGVERVGVLNDDETKVIDLAAVDAQPYFESMLELIEADDMALGRAREILSASNADTGLDLASVTLCTPIPIPPQIRDFLCFEEHLINGYNMLRKKKAEAEPDPAEALARFEREGVFAIPEIWYDQPVYYKPSRFGVIGTGQDVNWPPFSELLDYEMEFGAWVGTKGKDVSLEQARDMIFGYSIFNDISARDTQAQEMSAGLGPGKGKDFETGNIIGPCIVTADSFDPYNADMIVRINGEERSRGNSRDMHWKFEDCIAHTAQAETIYPGEFFCSGTVPWGCGLEHDLYLSDGDVVELEVTGIGVLKNCVVKQK
ncbi:MAG: fumarylacetoacetate hydrolase family protein [Alphaproteobacteria bacterium]|nr:fumarylacetoacetate hydrolase family protein [Alphaproteobacteria bacterium]